MDLFWLRLGMDKEQVKENRERAVNKMKEVGAEKIEGMKAAVEKYEGTKKKTEGQALKKEVAAVKPRTRKGGQKISLK